MVRDGRVLIDAEDFEMYVGRAVITFVLMGLAYQVWMAIFRVFTLDRYANNNSMRERFMYIQLWGSNVHHIILIILTMQIFLSPDCGADSYKF